MPAHLAGDILTAAQGIRDRHKELFTADRKLKDRAARLFRTVLPPRPSRPGRKRIASVTIAIRLLRKLKREDPNVRPERLWANVYPKAIPNYASLPNEVRWNEQRRLRDRVHGRKRQQQKRRKKTPRVSRPELLSGRAYALTGTLNAITVTINSRLLSSG
jgi:hypothetical protein